MLNEAWQVETRETAEAAFAKFVTMFEEKYPKATQCLQKDRKELLAFYDFPAKHWQSLRATNPIESSFGRIRHRTRRSKGLSWDGMLHMIFNLGECAERNWQRLRGFNCLGKVIEGVKLKDGEEVETCNRHAA